MYPSRNANAQPQARSRTAFVPCTRTLLVPPLNLDIFATDVQYFTKLISTPFQSLCRSMNVQFVCAFVLRYNSDETKPQGIWRFRWSWAGETTRPCLPHLSARAARRLPRAKTVACQLPVQKRPLSGETRHGFYHTGLRPLFSRFTEEVRIEKAGTKDLASREWPTVQPDQTKFWIPTNQRGQKLDPNQSDQWNPNGLLELATLCYTTVSLAGTNRLQSGCQREITPDNRLFLLWKKKRI